jgi:hypothetical protein
LTIQTPLLIFFYIFRWFLKLFLYNPPAPQTKVHIAFQSGKLREGEKPERLPNHRVNSMNKPGFWGNYEQKIVCNELRRQGLLSVTDWIHDASYCAKRFDPTTYRGYCLWAVPCLRMMRKHRTLARLLAIPVHWMVADIRYQHGARQAPHLLGFLINRGIFWPGNRVLGDAARRFGAPGRRISRSVRRNPSAAIPRVGSSINLYFQQGSHT